MALAKVRAEGEAPRRNGRLDYGSLERLLGFHVRLAQVAFYRDYVVAMKDLDLTQKQYAVLVLVAANPGVSQIDLAAALGVDRATMMAIVDRLQNRDLLQRVPSKIDRRRQELYLTAAGEQARAQAEAICDAHERPFLERFSPEELETLFGLLKRLHGPPGED
jgi:DNA-binding MarR family transcriptional regulator